VPGTISIHSLENPLATGPSYMIAGDGYAYFPYVKGDSEEAEAHLMLLRVYRLLFASSSTSPHLCA
jgi:hypothetical protein